MDDKPTGQLFDSVMPWPEFYASRELSFDEAALAANFINSRSQLPHDACQVCGDIKVVLQPALFPLSLPASLNSEFGRWAHPHVMTICYNCGFTRLFNAVVIGLKPRPVELEDNLGDGAANG